MEKFQEGLVRKPGLFGGGALFRQIPLAEGWGLSVQGNHGVYSEPREFVEATRYTSMEIAIFDPDGEMLSTRYSRWWRCLCRRPWAKGRFSFEQVAGYVPVADIQKLIDDPIWQRVGSFKPSGKKKKPW